MIAVRLLEPSIRAASPPDFSWTGSRECRLLPRSGRCDGAAACQGGAIRVACRGDFPAKGCRGATSIQLPSRISPNLFSLSVVWRTFHALPSYCSPSEQQTGWCKGAQPGGYGAGDSDAAPWLFNRNYGAEEVMTAADYLDVVAPLPTVKPNPRTAEEDAALVQARRQGAIMSGARAGLVGVLVGGMGGDRRQGGTP